MSTIFSRVLSKALEAGEAKAKAFCTSRQLRKGMFTSILPSIKDKAGKAFDAVSGAIRVPHYWAIYKHDGRNSISQPKGLLVYFRNVNNDPRLRAGESPVYRSDIRHLTPNQFRFWLAENRKARKRGTPPPMIVRKNVGPTDLAKANPFFSNAPGGGMAGFGQDVDRIASKEAYDTVERMLRSSGLKKKTIRRTIG